MVLFDFAFDILVILFDSDILVFVASCLAFGIFSITCHLSAFALSTTLTRFSKTYSIYLALIFDYLHLTILHLLGLAVLIYA